MDVTPLIPAGRQIIESYGGGRFRVGGTWLEGAILVFPDRTIRWHVTSIDKLVPEDLSAVADAGAAGDVALLLVGCGARMALIPPSVRQAMRAAGALVEAMDTGAACRTY
ncbi:MAG: Mth938-like domain-containing protein, partial [Dongiaceae bacterium]